MPHQVSAPPSPYLEARISYLEDRHADLHGEVDTLKDLYRDLYNSFDKVRQGGQSTHAHPSQDLDPTESRQSAIQLKQELEQLSREVRESVNSDADEQKANGCSTSKANDSVPAHVRVDSVTSHGSGTKSLPPHLRGAKQSGILNGNACVEGLHSARLRRFLLTRPVEFPSFS